MIKKNNLLYDKISDKELHMIPITYHFITRMSKARNYDEKEIKMKTKHVDYMKTMTSAYYQTDFMYLGINYKVNVII